MTIDLPIPISAYFQADKHDAATVSDCFTEDATVYDEHTTHTGREAIHAWKTGASKKYSYTVEPFKLEKIDTKRIVTAHVVGNFPGSPIDLRYFFELKDDKIAALEIKP